MRDPDNRRDAEMNSILSTPPSCGILENQEFLSSSRRLSWDKNKSMVSKCESGSWVLSSRVSRTIERKQEGYRMEAVLQILLLLLNLLLSSPILTERIVRDAAFFYSHYHDGQSSPSCFSFEFGQPDRKEYTFNTFLRVRQMKVILSTSSSRRIRSKKHQREMELKLFLS